MFEKPYTELLCTAANEINSDGWTVSFEDGKSPKGLIL